MPRKYQKRRRAEVEEATRERIVEALVDLHGSVGPLRTTVLAVAERAGVQRATVYRHFPDESSMFAACSAHWLEKNPLPDPADWRVILDPWRRVRVALRELYGFYASHEQMLTNLFREEPLVEALRPSMRGIRAYLDGAAVTIAQQVECRPNTRRVVRAAAGHAVAFTTWASLVRRRRLSRHAAIELMVGMIERAGQPATRSPGIDVPGRPPRARLV